VKSRGGELRWRAQLHPAKAAACGGGPARVVASFMCAIPATNLGTGEA
jgi:hypothetical protein